MKGLRRNAHKLGRIRNGLSATEAGAQLGVCSRTIDNWRRLGVLVPTIQVGKRRYFDPRDIARLRARLMKS